MNTTRAAGILMLLALQALTAQGAWGDAPYTDPNENPEGEGDSLTIQNLLEFGPLEDREALRKQSKARFMAAPAARRTSTRGPAAQESAPEIKAQLTAPTTYDLSGDLTVAAEVVPSSLVETVRLMVRRPGEVTYNAVAMRLTAPGQYTLTLGPEYTKRDYIKLYLEAVPLSGAEPVLHGSPKEPIVATALAPIAGGLPLWALSLPLAGIAAWKLARRQVRDILLRFVPMLRQLPLPYAARTQRHPAPRSAPPRGVAPRTAAQQATVPPAAAAAAAPHHRAATAESPRLEMNPYQVLRIQRSATLKEIDDAYCLMRKLNFYGTVRDPLALIDLAHDLLKDPESRREVDEALRHGETPAAVAPPRGTAARMKEAGS